LGEGVIEGSVVRFDTHRGYGFVAPDDGSGDVFIHANDLRFDENLLSPGTRLTFDVEDEGRGLKASHVQLVEKPARHAVLASRASVPAAGPSPAPAPGPAPSTSETVLSHEITELLLTAAPSMTSEEILEIRTRMVQFVRQHGWLDP
jgi:cold shock CspA family protein